MGNYHFIAIGGIGMSGLAKYLLQEGHTVSGSDIEESKYIDILKKLGAKISIGHAEENLPEDCTVVVSTAIRSNNPELIKAKRLGLKIFHRSDILAQISKSAQEKNKCFIGFSGTHGKTTTSGLASYVLAKANLKPSFVVGGIVPELKTNSTHDSGNYFVAELDESDGTLIKYSPDILVINNIEEDHIDFYKNGISDIAEVFNKATSQSKMVIINNDCNNLKLLKGSFITFGMSNADYIAKNIKESAEGTSFDVYHNEKLLISTSIQLTGEHNIYNTLAVISALNEGGVDLSQVNKYFQTFTGMGRRFQEVGNINGIKIYDDYAHHPTEIKATLDAASVKYGKENIVAVFQPHRYTRLKALWNEFLTSFYNSNRIIVTDVYSASEDTIQGVNSQNFAKELKNSEYISGSMKDVAQKLLPTLKEGNVIIGLGAGTITKLGEELLKLKN